LIGAGFMLRLKGHLWSWWAGEDADPETSLNHLAHAAWNCLALLEFARTHPERDDRQL